MIAFPRAALRTLAARSSVPCARYAPVASANFLCQSRGAAGAAASKVVKTLGSEIKHEEEQYEQAKEVKAFLKKTEFKLVDSPGDVNMVLERALGDKNVKVEWQLSSPFNPDEMEGEEGGESFDQEATDFMVSVETKEKGAGVTFYCSTQTGEDHRYVIGNVKAYGNAEERDSVSAYTGPEFEDVDENLQEAFDEYLAELGVNNEVCDFIDAYALDKEQQEYIRWLKITRDVLQAA